MWEKSTVEIRWTQEEKNTLTSSLSPPRRAGQLQALMLPEISLLRCGSQQKLLQATGRCSAPAPRVQQSLRELFKPCVPVRGHRRRSGVPIAVEGGIGRQAAGGLSLCRIGEPEDQVVQVRPDPGSTGVDEGLSDDRIDLERPDTGRVRGEVSYIFHRAEGRQRKGVS